MGKFVGCFKHKRYKAVNPPRCSCFICWAFYGQEVGFEAAQDAFDKWLADVCYRARPMEDW